jgi:murein DD-endopeptidase MepM/ murein hydrolase activator NlpD
MSSFLNRTVLILAATTAFVSLAGPSLAREPIGAEAAPVQLALLQAAGDTYTVQRGDTLFGISRKLGLSPEAIAEANDLGSGARIDAGMKLRLPGVQAGESSAARPQAAGRVITVSSGSSTYVVRSGDTVDEIAGRLGMTRKAFADLNNLQPPYALSVGRKLKGPPETRRAYVVAEGDSLEVVARRFSVSTRALAGENGLRSTAALKSGQRLTLPQGYRDRGPIRAAAASTRAPTTAAARPARPDVEPPAEAPSAAPQGVATVRVLAGGRVISVKGKPAAYTVRKGDTVDAIADRMGLSRKELSSLNGLKPPYTLRPGQVLQGPAETQRAYVAVAGDTLSVVARRFGVTPRALATANGLRSTASIRSGQRLVLPDGARDRGPIRETLRVPAPAAQPARPAPEAVTTDTDAPLEDPSNAGPPELRTEPGQPAVTRPPAPEPAPAPAPAQSQAPTPPAPAAAATPAPTPQPRPEPPRSVPPRVETPRPPVVAPPAPRPVAPPPRVAPAPAPPVAARPPSGGFTPPPTASTTPLTDAQVAALGKGRFLWPIRGEILSDFGPKGTGQRNDGINIRAARGAPVRASAAGEVVYAGDQVPGFGNLVLIKHPDGWVTAYAHLSNVDVKIQQRVLQGQQIGEAGDTGGVSEPQLHFEIRYAPTPAERARPVSPSLLLPR